MPEDDRAFGLDVIRQMHAALDLAQRLGQRGPSFLERRRPKITAVEFLKVKGVQEHSAVVVPVPQQLERRHAVNLAGHSLAID